MSEPSQPESYAAAVAELDEILAAIERDEVDVDVLSQRVARAVHLVSFCRGQLKAAEVEVERVVAELDPGQEPAGEPAGSGEPPAGDVE